MAYRALFGYTLLAVLMTWPLVIHFHDRVPMGDNDLWQNLWNLWWWREALFERFQLPYHTDVLFQTSAQPQSISLAFHTHSEGNLLPLLPVLLLAGPVITHNLFIFVGFVLAGWGAYLLARELGATPTGAFVGGVIFAFFPQHIEQSLEHTNLASYQAMPFFLLFLRRLVYSGGIKNIVATALLFSLNALYSWHNALMILPMALVLFVYGLIRTDRHGTRIILDAMVAGALATLCLLPFLLPKLTEVANGATYYVKPQVSKGVDALFLLVPPAEHLIWGGAFKGLYDDLRSYASVGFVCYLGWVPLLLALLSTPLGSRLLRGDNSGGASSARFSCWLWAGLTALYLLLSLGDALIFAGSRTEMPLPHATLRELPGFGVLRVANRFIVPAMLALAMLSAQGATRVLLSRPERSRLLAFLVLTALVLLDFVWLPYPLRALPQPAWPERVAADYPGLVLNIPGGYRARAAKDMYLQTLHGQPLVGGYTSCVLPEVRKRVDELPFLKLIFEGRPKVDVDIQSGLAAVLSTLAIDTVIVHLGRTREALSQEREQQENSLDKRLFNPEKGMPQARLDAIREALREQWGAPAYADDDVEIYRRTD